MRSENLVENTENARMFVAWFDRETGDLIDAGFLGWVNKASAPCPYQWPTARIEALIWGDGEESHD